MIVCSPTVLQVPETLGSLSKLRTLFLSDCTSLLALPEAIASLEQLQTIYLSGCTSLLSLPESIGACKQLRELDLGRCESLLCLPESLGSLPHLQMLLLGSCYSLTHLPHRMPPVVALFASGCISLTFLPERLSGQPPKVPLLFSPRGARERSGLPLSMSLEVHVAQEYPLAELNLYGCTGLVDLPKSIGSLRTLTNLDLGGCSSLGPTLPEGVGHMQSLKRLSLNGCVALEALPPLRGLLTLEELDLSNCRALRALPEGLGDLPALRVLLLHGCALIPSAVRMTSARPVRDEKHLREVLATMRENAEPIVWVPSDPEPEEEKGETMADDAEVGSEVEGSDEGGVQGGPRRYPPGGGGGGEDQGERGEEEEEEELVEHERSYRADGSYSDTRRSEVGHYD